MRMFRRQAVVWVLVAAVGEVAIAQVAGDSTARDSVSIRPSEVSDLSDAPGLRLQKDSTIVTIQPGESVLAIVGVNVVPMDEERVLNNQTVFVIGDRITLVEDSATTTIPVGAIRIAGNGRYLMPGLMDLHNHLRHSDEYVNYLKYGVTTVMHMGGSGSRGTRILEDRQRIEAGDILGPNIYATRQIFRGGADDVRGRVMNLKRDGYDFVKIYNEVTYAQFKAIVDEASKQGLPVFGHIPRGFDPLMAMKEGQNAIQWPSRPGCHSAPWRP